MFYKTLSKNDLVLHKTQNRFKNKIHIHYFSNKKIFLYIRPLIFHNLLVLLLLIISLSYLIQQTLLIQLIIIGIGVSCFLGMIFFSLKNMTTVIKKYIADKLKKQRTILILENEGLG